MARYSGINCDIHHEKNFHLKPSLQKRQMKNFILQNKLYLIGIVVGAVAGFFYWKFVGCANGKCMISSKPLNSTVYFAVVGALLFGMFKKEKKND